MTDPWDDDERDPLIDACLAEILGGEQPPDLTARILATLARGQTAGASDTSSLPVSLASSNGHPSPPAAAPLIQTAAAPARRANWRLLATVAAVLVVGVGLGLAALSLSNPGDPAERVVKRVERPIPPSDASSRETSDNGTQLADSSTSRAAASLAHNSAADANQNGADSQTTDEPPPFGHVSGDDNPAFTLVRATWPAAREQRQLVAEIDQSMQQTWAEHNLQPAPAADDEAWCRRAYLRLLGRIPTVDELRRFTADSSPDKHASLIERLHNSSEYASEYADHWAKYWTYVLIGNNPANLASRDGMFLYLREAIQQDKPVNRWAYELITATGAARPGDEQFNGAVNFLLANHSSDRTAEAAAVSRVLLGQRFQCAQCHDHPTNDALVQARFWELNALLRQFDVERLGEEQLKLVDRDAADEAVFFEETDGYKRAAYPVLPDGTILPSSPEVATINRRQVLAEWVAHSAELPRAVVNRVWSHFFGFGFANPIDDVGLHNPPSHPDVLNTLTAQFAAHGFHHRQLTEWLALTDAFRRSSEASEDNVADEPLTTGVALFSRYYTRQLQPQAIFNSLQLVAESRRTGSADLLAQFNLSNVVPSLGRTLPNDVHHTENAAGRKIVPFTGPLVQRAVSNQPGSVLNKVINSQLPIEKKVEHLFMAAVSRRPEPNELELALKMVSETSAETALQDIWWALLNSSEFILDH